LGFRIIISNDLGLAALGRRYGLREAVEGDLAVGVPEQFLHGFDVPAVGPE
jgi:hypothetical protein